MKKNETSLATNTGSTLSTATAKKNLKFISKLHGRDNQLVGLAFVSPFIVGFVLIFSKMLYDGLVAAFSTATMGNNGMEYTFAGWDNFYYALRVDPQFTNYAINDIKEMAITIPLVMIFSLFVAVLLNRDIWGKTFFRVIFFLPVIVSTGLLTKLDANNAVMTTMSAAAVSADAGAVSSISDISTFLQQLQFSPSLISMVSDIANNVVDIVTKSGVQILIFLAGIQSISPSVYEAASVEGATEWEKFWKITLPMVGPMIVVNLFYTLIECLTSDTTSLMSYINYNAFTNGRYGEAAAMSWTYFAVVVALIAIVYIVVKLIMRQSRKMD